jgi:hypothetical protein
MAKTHLFVNLRRAQIDTERSLTESNVSKTVVFIRRGTTIRLRMFGKNQNGFIPLMITLLVILLAVIAIVYLRVQRAH